jgi:hypothetical protein
MDSSQFRQMDIHTDAARDFYPRSLTVLSCVNVLDKLQSEYSLYGPYNVQEMHLNNGIGSGTKILTGLMYLLLLPFFVIKDLSLVMPY